MSFAFNCTNYYVGNLEDNILNAKSENPKQYRKYIRNLVKTNSTSETIPVLKTYKNKQYVWNYSCTKTYKNKQYVWNYSCTKNIKTIQKHF